MQNCQIMQIVLDLFGDILMKILLKLNARFNQIAEKKEACILVYPLFAVTSIQ